MDNPQPKFNKRISKEMTTNTQINDVDVFNWFRTVTTDKAQMMIALVQSELGKIETNPAQPVTKSHRGRKPGTKNKPKVQTQTVSTTPTVFPDDLAAV